jgi:hypothetical protein
VHHNRFPVRELAADLGVLLALKLGSLVMV